jgi:hypothetical protein
MPLRYNFIGQELKIQPMPDITTYDVLVLRYFQTPNGLVSDTDQTVIEGPAMMMYAEILVKEHFGGIDTTQLRADFGRYLTKRRTKQSDGSGFQMGGNQALVTSPQRRNRFSRGRASSWSDWRPW